MRKNIGNLALIGFLIVLNILFYAMGGMIAAIEVSPLFGAAMGLLLLAPLAGTVYLTLKEWRK